jgi:group I intron endonuclease
MKSGIYKIENQITKDVYIGSSVNLSNRKSRHFKDLEKNIHHSIILQRAVNKYGIENFNFIIIEKCDKNSLLIREQYYLDTLLPLYNILTIAGNSLGHVVSKETKEKSRKYALKNNIRPPESTWKERQQEILMLDKISLKILRTFESLSSACRFLGKNETYVSTLSSCCNNKRFSAFGYRWVYSIEDIPKLRDKKPLVAWNKGLKIDNKKAKKVKQFDLQGNFIKEWDSVKEAEEAFGKGVSNCALGRSKSSNRYYWSY